MRTETPGRLFALALALKELWPAGPLMPSAFPNTVFSGLDTFKVGSTRYPFAPRLLSCLRINQRVATLTARLDSRPVASGYLGRFPSCKMPRHCQAAANGLTPFLFPFLFKKLEGRGN